MRLDALKLIEDARIACDEVAQFANGRSEDEFRSDIAFQRSVERSLEIAGEALRRLRDVDRVVADSIPDLSRVIGLRNILAHGYDSLDRGIIWSVVTEHLPNLRSELVNLSDSNRQA